MENEDYLDMLQKYHNKHAARAYWKLQIIEGKRKVEQYAREIETMELDLELARFSNSYVPE